MNYKPIRSMLLTACVMVTIGLAAMVTPALADDYDVLQFGAVSYLADSGFYGVTDAPALTNPMPMPDNPSTYLLSPGFDLAMLNCLIRPLGVAAPARAAKASVSS